MSVQGPGWRQLLPLLGCAALLRALFYSGFFGSDELTYVASSMRLLDGDWAVPSYVGANRYGVNLPMALFSALFGRSEFSAALYSLLCSLAEIALLAWMGARLLGPSVALLGAWLLALTPLHIHLAGRLMADAPMALAVSASFLFFFEGERRGSRAAYLLAGLAMGWSFWIKPAAVFYGGVFLLVPLVWRCWRWQWLWMAGGFAFMMLANCALFAALTGEWAYLFRVMAERQDSGYLQAELSRGAQHDAPWYYLAYLFGKIWHTGLLGPLALLGFWQLRRGDDGARQLLLWGLGLLAILSLLPVSFAPLTWVPKQTNYMSLFLAPLALAGAYSIVQLGRWLWALVLPPALLSAALLQTQVAVFTANSHALVARARAEPGQRYWATPISARAARFDARLNGPLPKVRKLEEWQRGQPGMVYWDMQTADLARDRQFPNPASWPACWSEVERLQARPRGVGPALLRLAVWPLPDLFRRSADNFLNPKPALIFSTETC